MDVEQMGALRFTNESASAVLDFLSIDMGIVTSVYSLMRGMGDGTGLIKMICDYADANDMQLMLYVGSYELKGDDRDDGLSVEQLVAWYEKFGFKPQLQSPFGDEHPQMIRQPWREKHGRWTYPEEDE